ncbi:hypothetical protein F4819DRAFT_489398 [Hypoxylon fuscum]|nr:hypothetical protein F4819DRAFT_489398 [Hypoxylon fuscum]
MECSVCLEHKQLGHFPQSPLTGNCSHRSSVCIECVTSFINSQVQDGATDQFICPECPEQLQYSTIQMFASGELFALFQSRSIERLISKIPNFVWCPFNCGTGQRHWEGANQPLIFCLKCNRHFCYRHRIAWHSDYTCDEYDAYLADPLHFRSRAQIQRAADEALELENRRLRQLVADAEARFAQSLLREEQAAEARRRAEQQRLEEERRQAEERARREEERRRKAEELLQLKARIEREEAETSQALQKLIKKCPGCKVPIEKNHGW